MNQITEKFQELQDLLGGGNTNEQPNYLGLKQSQGHIGFLGGFEFFLQNETLLAAPVDAAFDFDTGTRTGEIVATGPQIKKILLGLIELGMTSGDASSDNDGDDEWDDEEDEEDEE